MVGDFRHRPLEGGPCTYVWIDALTQCCREGGRLVNICTAIATAVNTDGYRAILGVDVFTAEDGAAWTSFLREHWRQIWSNNPPGAAQQGSPPANRRGRHLP